MKSLRLAVLSCVPWLLCACALGPKFQTPRLSVADVQVQGGTLWEQRLKVRVHVQNPNDRELPIKGIDYTLQVDGQDFADGVSAASFVVPALGEAEFDMNVTTNIAGALLRLAQHTAPPGARGVPYRMHGHIALSSGLLRSIPFDERGSFRLQ
ncbi:MAG: LEA type 2 family protein [Proteobacteria bacterium]|nr:LEA type 2 family protein [Pseudomonadota bacterium]